MEWFEASTQRRTNKSPRVDPGLPSAAGEVIPDGVIHASDGSRTACGRDASKLILWPDRPWRAHGERTCPTCDRLTTGEH
jgi:hypothetical protein